jgi:hypothetical protein
MTARGRVTHDGKVYCSVEETARMLATTTRKIRELMGSGDLEWVQLRINGRLFVPAESILALKRQRVQGSRV